MSARLNDANGWYEIKRNPLAKVGVFQYRGSSIGASKYGKDDNAIYKVYRPASELCAPSTLNSLRLLPWVDDHAMLSENDNQPNRVSTDVKPVAGVIGENITFDNGIIYGNIKRFSKKLGKKIDAGKKHLSLGYTAQYDWTPGTAPDGSTYDCVQTNVTFNHVASVGNGRMGPDVAVLDSADEESVVHDDETLTLTYDEKDFEMSYNKQRVDILVARAIGFQPGVTKIDDKVIADIATMDSMEVELNKAGPATIEDAMQAITEIGKFAAAKPVITLDSAEFKAAIKGQVDTAVEAFKKTLPTGTVIPPVKTEAVTMDAAMITTAVKEAMKPMQERLDKINPKAIRAEGAQCDALVKQLTPFIGTFDASDMDLAGIAAYGIDKLKLGKVPEGSEVSVLNAYMTGRKPVQATATLDHKEPKAGSQVAALLVEPKAA